jgi:predicted transcriptional regulator
MLKLTTESREDVAKVADYFFSLIAAVSKTLYECTGSQFNAIQVQKEMVKELITFQEDNALYGIEISTYDEVLRIVITVDGSQVGTIEETLF